MTQAKTKNNNGNGNKLPLEARVIQSIADFPAPKTSQDTVDQLAAEYMTASLLRQNAEKRYDKIKSVINDEFPVYIAKVRNEAVETMTKATTTLIGSDWQFDFAANKPATRVDVDQLRTELVKMGVSAKKIDEAIKAVEKKATPALIITAKPVV